MKFTYVFCIRSFFVRERIEFFFFRLFPNALKTVTSVRMPVGGESLGE